MFRKALSYGGLLLLAGAMVLVTPGFGQARGGGGGGHGGGGHGGGGGFHGGGGGFHGGGGGFHGGGFRGSGFRGSGFHNGGFHRGFNGGFGGYGYYPSYGDYGYSPYYYNNYAYDSPSSTSEPGYYGAYGDETSSYPDSYYSVTPPTSNYQYGYSPAPAGADASAQLTVRVPANAEIWVNGSKTTSTGPVRQYQSPPLAPGKQYAYDLSARWTENGREVTQKQTVDVSPGAHVNVAFPTPPAQTR